MFFGGTVLLEATAGIRGLWIHLKCWMSASKSFGYKQHKNLPFLSHSPIGRKLETLLLMLSKPRPQILSYAVDKIWLHLLHRSYAINRKLAGNWIMPSSYGG